MGKNTKDKAAVVFRQLSSIEVLGEIITETGNVAISKNFGVMTEDEYKKIMKLMELENPDIAWCDPIELTGN
jgi:ATP sulfurylase